VLLKLSSSLNWSEDGEEEEEGERIIIIIFLLTIPVPYYYQIDSSRTPMSVF
jgi:hypothetical protein